MRFAITILLALLVATVAFAGEKGKLAEPPVPTTRALDCSNAIAINCGDVVTGNTYTNPNVVEYYSCVGWQETGGEVVYELTLEGPDCYIVTAALSNVTGDPDVFVLGSCDENDCIAYGNLTATTNCLEPGTYYIVVDGYYGNPDCDYTLTVDCEVCACPEEPCCPSVYVCDVVDFNVDDGGFYTEDCGGVGSCFWEWGQPLFDPGSAYGPIPDLACDDVPVTNLLATDLDAFYANCGERAIIGPFDITASCWCMELCHYYDTEFSYDGGNVKVSADGGATWNIVHPARGYDDDAAYSGNPCVALEPIFSGHAIAQGGAFVRDCFDLSNYVGQSILVAFDFGADGSIFYPGWYIKWVKIGSDEFSPVEDATWGGIKAMYR
ncbi:MAG: hypothetical protein GF400_09170 [Candidatus Eisenbacteria bacterium]|nr:hypothetical protein [Candidatus Eisenbacteria bacterium]